MKDQVEDLKTQNPPTLKVDYALYAQYLEEADLSESEKRELIDGVWSIICEFILAGFHLHSTQQALENCGQAFAKASQNSDHMLKQDSIQEGPAHE